MLDNFSSVQEWFGKLFLILKPFLIGLLISYILFIPCRKIESIYKKAKLKFISKKMLGIISYNNIYFICISNCYYNKLHIPSIKKIVL